MDGECHVFVEAAHREMHGFTAVHVWRREGVRPLVSSHAEWEHMSTEPAAADDPSGVRYRLPFDDQGRPTLEAPAGTTSWARGDVVDDADRRVSGRTAAVAGDPERRLLFRELWLTTPPVFRIGEGVDFDLVDDHGPVARCFLMASPLLVTRPARVTVGEHLRSLGARGRELAAGVVDGRERETGHLVELWSGANVEIVGPVRIHARASLGLSGPYRTAATEPPYRIGRVPLARLRVTVTR